MSVGIFYNNPVKLIFIAAVGLILAVANIDAHPQQNKSAAAKSAAINKAKAGIASQDKQSKTPDKFHRPAPTTPIKPSIGSVSRFQPNKVFLEQADSLYKPEGDVSDRQIVKGSVVFRQANMWLYCDSAYFYPEQNSLDAFGHVKLKQSSVTSMQADRLFYNGNSRFARLRCGKSQSKVILHDKTATLTTDSLDYDLNTSLGWYDKGGVLVDGPTKLTSLYGQYNTESKDADFYHNVVLHNSEDNYTLLSDTLYYNTATNIARIVSPTTITTADDEIHATYGWYNSATGMTELTSRSIITHRDSAGNVTTLEGDSLIYDKVKRISQAFSFRDSRKYSSPVVLTDTANKTTLIGGYGMYDQLRKVAMATDYPLLIEYSRPDTLFLRADTIYSYVVTLESETVPDSIATDTEKQTLREQTKEYKVAKAYRRARFFNQQCQGIADSIILMEQDSILRMYYGPVVWSGERQVYGPVIFVHFNDSTADYADLPVGGTAAEFVDAEETDSFFNQLRGKKMHAIIKDKALNHLDIEGNVETMVLPQESDSTYNRLVSAESSFMTVDLTDNTLSRLKMWPEVSGYVTPLFLLKPGQQLLRDFKWYEHLRPERIWYGTIAKWADNLGEVDDALNDYFISKRKEGIPDIPEPEKRNLATKPKQEFLGNTSEENKDIEPEDSEPLPVKR